MSIETSIAIVFAVVWIFLLIGLFYAYFWLRNRERDTRLPEEVSLTPRLEVFGSGRVNQRQWTRAKGCRISVYDEFLVVSASSQRLRLPLRHVRNVAYDEAQGRLTFEGLTANETLVRIAFKDASGETLRKHLDLASGGSRTHEAPT